MERQSLRGRDKSPFSILISLQVSVCVWVFILFSCPPTQNAWIPSPTKVFRESGFFSFCLWPGTLGCRITELSRLLHPFQTSLVVMALIWEGGAICLHTLSSVKASGSALHALIPVGLCKWWARPPTSEWIQCCLKWVQYGLTHSLNEPSEIWMLKGVP